MKNKAKWLLGLAIIAAFTFVFAACSNPASGDNGYYNGGNYTVTFHGNNNTGGTAPGAITGRVGSIITIPGNTGWLYRTGYTFTGWNTQADGGGVTYAVGFPHTITGNLNLFANWTAAGTPIYTITFQPNGAASGSVPQEIPAPAGATVFIPGNPGGLYRTGYIFTGWNTQACGGGITFTANSTHTITGNLNLFANWTAAGTPMYTITFHPNHWPVGGNVPQQITAPAGDTVVIPGNTGGLSRFWYLFAGWNTQAGGGGTPYIAGSTHTVTGNLNLFAMWSLAPTVTLTFHPNGATGGSVPQPVTVPVGEMVWADYIYYGGLYRTWYLFTGWNTQACGGGISRKPGENFTIYEDINLFAIWTLAPVMVWEMVSAGVDRSFAIRDDGSLWSWGRNIYGVTGLGTTTGNTYTPTRVGTDNDWIFVSAGGLHTLGIRADGSLWAWGLNEDGRTGLGIDTGNTLIPTRVGTDNNWVSVSAGSFHSHGIRADGSLWAWGWNSGGRTGLGIDTLTGTLTPTRVGTANNWVSVSAGCSHSLAIRDDDSLWTWGLNALGGTGLDTGTALTPTRVGIEYNWISVSAGFGHSHGIRADGSLWAWGSNWEGVTGLGTTTGNTYIPTRVGIANNWAYVAAGLHHSIGIRADGSLWAWGFNYQEEIGQVAWITPTRVGTANNWVFASAGGLHSLGIRNDGLWAWGVNGGGQVGVGSHNIYNAFPNPIRVRMP